MDQIPDDPAARVYRLSVKQNLETGQHFGHPQDARRRVGLEHRDMPGESQQPADLGSLAVVKNHPAVSRIAIFRRCEGHRWARYSKRIE